ncbi:MAG TPA: DUF308 domain-containing protein [Steroidobacteraceae bacterium]|nr:DUF308 domain-containing protein [Steroidobacteraceae bacterium]
MNTPAAQMPEIDAARQRVLATIHAHRGLFLLQGILMSILGMAAVALPNLASIGVTLLVGWLFIAGGFVRATMTFRKHLMPGRTWSVISSVIAVAVGALLIARPLQGVRSLTLLMAVLFLVEGIAAVFVALEFRRFLRSWVWTLASGLINLLLAFLIWSGWPNTATWVVGLYVGINMMFIGVALIASASAAHGLEK